MVIQKYCLSVFLCVHNLYPDEMLIIKSKDRQDAGDFLSCMLPKVSGGLQ